MKHSLEELLKTAVARLQEDGVLPAGLTPAITVERTRDRRHGDFASNLAMTLARPARRNPRELAEVLVQALPASELVGRWRSPAPASSTSGSHPVPGNR
jgi:arginyl-tRNA synthetase